MDETDSAVVRDAYDVLQRFGGKIDTDTVSDSNASEFVNYLDDHLRKNAPALESARPLAAKSKVYLYYFPPDAEYALDVAAALEERDIETLFPVLDGSSDELKGFHSKYLRECDAVVLCWANAPESWTITTSEEFDDWRSLGRTDRFLCRGVVAGPPPHSQKGVRKKRLPKQIDVLVDLTDGAAPTPQTLEPLILRTLPS
jgi:hypothetical protein